MRRNFDVPDRFLIPPKTSFFLFGPRGTGKTSWARRIFQKAIWVDLLDPATLRRFGSRPEELREKIEGSPDKKQIVIDEVQKVPALLDVVHALIEEKKGLQFILTGSSARKLKRTGVNLLAGRARLCSMHPFLAAELGKTFRLDRALQLGMLPLVLDAQDPAQTLQSYVGLYLKEEVQSEGLVRNIGDFARFLEVISFSHANLLNLSHLGREAQIGYRAAEGYVQILEDLLLSFRIPIFTKRAKRETVAHSKFFLFDAGVYRSLRSRGPLDTDTEIDGSGLEGLIVQQVRAWNAYRGTPNTLYFWRTRSNVEVDLVVYGEDGFWAIEVKNSPRVRPEDLKSLRSFGEDYPESTRLLLYRGKEKLKKDGVLCIPCEEFLLQIHPKKKALWG